MLNCMDGTSEACGGGQTRITNCSGFGDHYPGSVQIANRADGRIELSILPGSVGILTPELAEQVRAQLADAIADALQGVRWTT